MKNSSIFSQYVWLLNILRHHGRLSLEELNDKWREKDISDGVSLSRTTFNRHKDAIFDMFGVIIDCDRKDGYRYYISNPEVLEEKSIERWMLNSLTVGTVLADSQSIHEKILLERVPGGEEHLQTIIRALKERKRLEICYARFGQVAYNATVSPYALKLWHQRWYLLGFNGQYLVTYSLDRMREATMLEKSFTIPVDFSAEEYFNEYYGVLTDTEKPIQDIIIRAYTHSINYLRTLPLHPTQRELESNKENSEYVDFSYRLRPTPDFLNALASIGPYVEVISPFSLREEMKQFFKEALSRYAE